MLNSILKKFMSFSFGSLISAFIGLISTPIITQFILPEEFGKASMFLLATNLLLQMNLLGLDQSYIRYYNDWSVSQRATALKKIFGLVLLASIALFFGIITFLEDISIFLFDDLYPTVVYILSASICFSAIFRLFHSKIRMANKGWHYSFLLITKAALTLVFTISFALYIYPDFRAIVYGSIASLFLVTLFSFFLSYKLTPRNQPAINKEEKKTKFSILIKYGLPFVPTFLLSYLFQTIDRAYLRIFADFTELGLYSASLKIAAALIVLQTGFASFWVPFSYERYTKDKNDREVYKLVFDAILLVFSMVICLVLIFDKVILLLFSSEYSAIINIFPFLLLPPMFYTLSEITVVGINFEKKTSYHLYIIIISLLINASIGYFSIQHFGALGAAISMAIGYCAFFVLRTYLSLKLYKVHYEFKKASITLISLGFVIATSYLSMGVKYFSIFLFLLLLFILYKGFITNVFTSLRTKQPLNEM